MNRILILILFMALIYFSSLKMIDNFTNTSISPEIQRNKKKICILQYDDRLLDEKLSHLKNLNMSYCKIHNIDYRFYTKVNKEIPPYWAKIYLLQKLLPFFDYILWIDSDATLVNINNLDFFISKIIENKDMVISGDMPPWVRNSPFNAGVFCVKNSKIGQEIVNEWMSKYNSKKWKKDSSNKWKCRGRACNWAGANYEQGSFVRYILPKYRDNIKTVSWKYINNPFYDKRTKAIFHFAAEYKEILEKIYKTITL